MMKALKAANAPLWKSWVRSIVPRRIRYWTWAHRGVALLFLLTLWLGRHAWFPWFRGSTTATRPLGLFWLADPFATLEIALAHRGVQTSLIVAALLIALPYALLGRVFCGWVCPLGLLLDLNDDVRVWLRRRLRRYRIHLPEYTLPRHLKYGLLVFFVALSAAARVPAFQTISPINLLVRGLLFGTRLGWGLILAIVLVEYVAPRVWCRALCPLGAFYSLLGRWGRWHIHLKLEEGATCKGCGLCARECPMDIPIYTRYVLEGDGVIRDMECTRCGTCVDLCPTGVLKV